jgi:hypothetical protein
LTIAKLHARIDDTFVTINLAVAASAATPTNHWIHSATNFSTCSVKEKTGFFLSGVMKYINYPTANADTIPVSLSFP